MLLFPYVNLLLIEQLIHRTVFLQDLLLLAISGLLSCEVHIRSSPNHSTVQLLRS
jgi:hypothetical protein